jgi:methylated-DNA-[protein]-cysteine S-methyltransferase
MSDKQQMLMPSPLGDILLETDGHAITMIHFCDEPMKIDNASHPLLLQAKSELEQYFAGERQSFSFPMAQIGTEFQQRVWQMLTSIPLGKTISYRTLAIQLGDEKCIRAAGTANGKNQIAVAVPCHRVIGSNGELVGYAGGLWRKQWLLDHEAKMCGKAVQPSLF